MKKNKPTQKKKRDMRVDGPSLADLGFNLDNKTDNAVSESKIVNDKNDDTNIGNAKDGTTENDNTKVGNTNINNTNVKPVRGKSAITARRSLHLAIIRDALNKALGNSQRVEIKLCDMQRDLDINPKTFYRHLKKFRKTDFEIKRLIYGTELKRLKK